MKNIDYVIKNFNLENGNSKMIIDYRCPTTYGLQELDCELFDCEDCWNLEIEDEE